MSISLRMKLQVAQDQVEKAHTTVWDFRDENFGHMHWFLWFANDPPILIRITCESQELRESMIGFFDNSSWKRITPESDIPFYEEGDEVWMLSIQEDKLYAMISPKLEAIVDS